MNNEINHKFFSYEKAIINFVFSFSWNVIDTSFDELWKNIKERNLGWQRLPLYKRSLSWISEEVQASYHPTITSDNVMVLHKHVDLEEKVKVLSPYISLNNIEYKEIDSSVKFDIRLYENGTGTFTFSFFLDETSAIDFEKILLLQHLAISISHNSREIAGTEANSHKFKHFTHSFIKVSESLQEKYKIQEENIYLSKLFSTLLHSFEELSSVIWDERKLISSINETESQIDDNEKNRSRQNPYVISILQVEEGNFRDKLKEQDELTIKEIGAIAVRLTQDNGESAQDYFQDLRREYIYKSLGFFVNPQDINHPKLRLRNYSHSRNLLYTYGRRAAIAITNDFENHPSYFAIPTFINILEILRSRWHLGTITNLKLDETFEKISHREDINRLIDEIFDCRVLYGLFLQNPTPYLFDSGAVTEISDSAEDIFWLSKIEKELDKKLDAIDKLIEVKFTIQRIKEYL